MKPLLFILLLTSCTVSRYTMLNSDLKVQTMPHRLIKTDTVEVFTLLDRNGKDSVKGHRIITTFTQKGGIMRNLTIKEREYLMRSNSVEDYEKRLIKLKAFKNE